MNYPAINCPLGPPASTLDDQEILDNIDGRMHGPMKGFIRKYFGHFQYVRRDAVLEIQAAGRVRVLCAVPSAAPSPDNFIDWFSNYASRAPDGARGSWHIFSGNGVPEHEKADEGVRLLLTMPATLGAALQTGWDHVQVIGQFYRHGCVSYRDGLLRLCRSAHEVFASQPTRLFLHGFYIRGSLIELWVFDRSGLYCSDEFHVRKDFDQFFSTILSYQGMTDQELGNINIIETDKNGSYITLDTAGISSFGKLYLESQPIASREGLVGTGTTCYRARMPDSDRYNFVLKFKWRWARDRPEDELLRLAKEKCVWGAISLDYYKEVESTAALRQGLRWGHHRKFTEMRFRETQGSIEEQQQGIDRNYDGLAEYTEQTNNFFQNRILACIVTSPVGRSLHTFQSLTELLKVFRDAIKCHRSLFYDAKLLHQDVSPGNIIILDGQDQEDGKPEGILIDLDSATEITKGSETESGITGTRPFMAIEVLKGEFHTYRHDLESFLYVFLWTIITDNTENPSETSKLREWSNGAWDDIAARKFLDMDQEGFPSILEEFAPRFYPLKPLAESLRQILFPLRDGVIWTGTDDSPEAVANLYDGMIRTFDEAIASGLGR